MEKIKVSDIRAKFPMYQDLNDDQLISGIRQKFYSDIPIAKFAGMIDYDTQREALGAEVTDAMGAGGRFIAGVGKAFTDVARGAGQVTGSVSREDVKQARANDAALMRTTGGKVGNLTGNLAAMLPAALVPGAGALPVAAGIGAFTGAIQPSESTGETLSNTAFGAAAGPAGVLLGRGIAAGAGAIKGLVQPFTRGGQEQIAAATLRQFASDPTKAAASLKGSQQLVPGSAPTMAQASGDAGLAQLERTLVNNPETGPALAAQFAAQRAARLEAVQGLAGNEAQRTAAVTAREAATSPLYQQATNAAYQVDDKLASLLKRPVMQAAMQRAQRLAENNGGQAPQFVTQTSGAFAGVGGAPVQARAQITGKGLQDLKMAIDDMLSDPLAGIGKNEAGAVKSIRADLISWMESANPAFKAARTTFAEKSKPINTMDVAQSLMDKMQPALARYGASTREHAQAYAAALEAAKETVKKATGINRPMDEVIDQQAKQILENVAKDMARKVAADEAGRAVGSNTAQNLAAQNMLRRTLGPAGLPQSWAESNALQAFLSPYTGVAKLAGSENAVMNRLSQAAMDPQDAARLLMMAQPKANALMPRALPYANALSLGYAGQK